MLFSSESVTEGHPDKVCDLISDSILDHYLTIDPNARVACETLAKSDTVVLAGEITARNVAAEDTDDSLEDIVRKAIQNIGYLTGSFSAGNVKVIKLLTQQSPDIAQGVDAKAAQGKDTDEQGAGDQGLMFGYATDETEQLMPAPIYFSHRLAERLTTVRKNGLIPGLGPDGKTQVTINYQGNEVWGVDTVVLSTQHDEAWATEDLRREIRKHVIDHVLHNFNLEKTKILINPTGRFTIGGPEADSGLTGRKIIVDTYGGMGRHGGGAFSGKDPSKVDRSAAYYARYVAKNIVAAKLAKKAEVQIAYAIGYPHPVSISVDTFGTGVVEDKKIVAAISELFDFRPASITKQLDLLQPIYTKTTNYGHFGKANLPWEQTDRAEKLFSLL